MGNQAIAYRGFTDSDGSITGTPGLFVGSHNLALSTTEWGTTTWTPGYRVTLGYRMEDGISMSVTYAYLFDAKYTACLLYTSFAPCSTDRIASRRRVAEVPSDRCCRASSA